MNKIKSLGVEQGAILTVLVLTFISRFDIFITNCVGI
jgi:hypothetical protein